MTTVVITLEIEGAYDAADIVDRVLDNGTIQEAITEYAEDILGAEVEVTSAVVS